MFEPNYALIHPTRTVSELRRVCIAKGVEIFEQTAVTGIARDGSGIVLETRQARVRASKAMLATNAAVPLLKRLRAAFIPIYDYSLVTEPLTPAQWAGIGWTGEHGIADSGNQFHYFRKTPDGRMLWAGYDAIYHYGSSRDAANLQRAESFERLATRFAATFPSLAGVSFSHASGSSIPRRARHSSQASHWEAGWPMPWALPGRGCRPAALRR